jgi:putative membrane protein
MRDWFTMASLFTAVLVGIPAAAQEREWGMHPMWWMWGAGGLVMMFMMLVFWGVVIAGFVVAIRWLVAQGRRDQHDRALDILRERYARGEIDKQEFETKSRDLGGRSG